MTIISKSELINMLWGIATHDNYWVDLNIEIIGGGGMIVAKSEQDFARKIGMSFLQIRSALREIDATNELDIPSIVLSGDIPKDISGTKLAEYLNICIEHASLLSNENT